MSWAIPKEKFLSANSHHIIALLMISGNLGAAKWDLEEISTCF